MSSEKDNWFIEHFDSAGTAFGLRLKRKLESVQTDYQHIEMWDTDTFGYLMTIDGATMLTTRDNFLYHEMMAHPALFSHAAPRNVLIIGGGDCGTLREVLRHGEVASAVQIDIDEQPHKSAGFLTGIPAPVGAGLAFLPFYCWMATGLEFFRDPLLVGPWLAVIAVLMISNLATMSWASLRPRRTVRLELLAFVALLFAALLIEPWWTLVAICLGYLVSLPYGWMRYAKIKRQRAARPAA